MRQNLHYYWQLLGTPAAISLPVAYWFFPFGFIGPLSIDPERLGGTTLQWFTIGVIAELFLILVFLGINRAFTTKSAANPWRNLLLLVGAIFLRSLVLTVASLFFTTEIWRELTYRVIAGFTGPLPTILLIAITYASWVRQSSMTKQLRRDTAELHRLEELSRQDNNEIRHDLIQEINVKIEPLLTQFRQALEMLKLDRQLLSATSAAYQKVQDGITALREQLLASKVSLVAPNYSYELTDEMLGRRFQWPKTLQVQRAMQPLIAILLFGIPAVSQAIRGMSPLDGLIFVVALSAIASSLIWLASKCCTRLTLPTMVAVVVAGIVYGAAGFIATAVLQLVGLAPDTSVIGSATLVGFNLGAFVAVYQAFSQRQANLNAALVATDAKLAQELARVRQDSWVTRRRLELVLHGSVQSSLHAAILRLTTAKEISRQTIDQIQRDLEASVAGLDEEAVLPRDVPEVLGQIKETWRGACYVRDEIDASFVADTRACQTLAQSVIEVFRESVHNSAVHGDAKNVAIGVEKFGTSWVVEIKDDGRGPGESDRKGFGSRMLDEIASEWSLTPGPSGGAVLRVKLPAARAELEPAPHTGSVSDISLTEVRS